VWVGALLAACCKWQHCVVRPQLGQCACPKGAHQRALATSEPCPVAGTAANHRPASARRAPANGAHTSKGAALGAAAQCARRGQKAAHPLLLGPARAADAKAENMDNRQRQRKTGPVSGGWSE